MLSSEEQLKTQQRHRRRSITRGARGTGVKLSGRDEPGWVSRVHPGWPHRALLGQAPGAGGRDRTGQARRRVWSHPAPAPHSLRLTELVPQQGKGKSLQSDREVARDEAKSPGRHWVLQRVLDAVEEHLAQLVHGLEDVLHGVDPARLREEGERGTARGQGTHVWPGVHTESHLLFPGLVQRRHSLAFGSALHPFSSSKHLWAMLSALRCPRHQVGQPPPAALRLRGSRLTLLKLTMAV